MLATMRATTHTYPLVQSRPDSRASSHGSSAAATPTRTKADKARTRAGNNAVTPSSNASGRKPANQRKPAASSSAKSAQPSSDGTQDFSKLTSEDVNAAKLSQTPGLLSLSKPLSELQEDSDGFTPARTKKGRTEAAKKGEAGQSRTRQQRSSSPPADGSTPAKGGAAGKNASRNARRNNRNGHDKADPSVDLLSKSAPSGSLAHAKASQKAARAVNEATAATNESSSGLTWQQELLRSSAGSLASKHATDLRKSSSNGGSNKRNSAHVSASASKHDGILAQPQLQTADSSALTWQQELLGGGAKKRNGPQYDVFADARDAETFGGSDGSAVAADGKGRRRARAGSVGSSAVKGKSGNRVKQGGHDTPLHIDDVFNNSSSDLLASAKNHRRGQSNAVTFAQSDAQQPSTPAKKQTPGQQHPSVAAAIAYAGPNFHNSPSPASLPAPKFSSRLQKGDVGPGFAPRSALGAGSGSGTGSSSSASGSDDDDFDALRKVRSTTAPAELHASPSPAPVAAPAPPAAEVKKTSEPGATVESLLARMMGGAKFF